MISLETAKIGVIGLGYVGLPLALEFGKQRPTVGFDIQTARLDELRKGHDSTGESTPDELAAAQHLSFTSDLADLKGCNVYIVTVPTPIDNYKTPDLTPLKKASETIGSVIAIGDVVVYESTVYPGATEEDCIPIIERISGLTFNVDFFAGYSPERINPGDKANRLPNIVKVTSGSTPQIADFVDDLYATIITAGTYKATSIKVAEAAKVIENTQRDVNIALINEFSLIFDKMGIDTTEVLQAAGTKWNFLPFRPGLVGGHCIGVDPYYLTYKAQACGYHPELVLAGRRLNDGMSHHVAMQLIKYMLRKGLSVAHSSVLILGFTFKPNCPDVRNTRIIDIVRSLRDLNVTPTIVDPCCDPATALVQYGVTVLSEIPKDTLYSGAVLAVDHKAFANITAPSLRRSLIPDGVIFDCQSFFDKGDVDGRL